MAEKLTQEGLDMLARWQEAVLERKNDDQLAAYFKNIDYEVLLLERQLRLKKVRRNMVKWVIHKRTI